MKGIHWAIVGMVISGFATQIASLHTWGEATSPAFVSGMLLTLGGVLTAVFSDKPRSSDAQTRVDDPPKP